MSIYLRFEIKSDLLGGTILHGEVVLDLRGRGVVTKVEDDRVQLRQWRVQFKGDA